MGKKTPQILSPRRNFLFLLPKIWVLIKCYFSQMNTVLKENRLEDVIDKRCTDVDEESVEALLEIAERCTDANPENRPAMNQVAQLLEQEVMSPSSGIDYYDDSHSDYC